jgi:hypothetical protein
LRWSGEANSWIGKRRWGRERGMVSLHGLQKLRGSLQIFLPKGKEVAQSAPDLQMFVGRGQIERESWQGEASGLGTLSPGPAPLPPLMDSLPLLALLLLGGRAVGFSRRSVAASSLRLLIGRRSPLVPAPSLLRISAGVGIRFGAVGDGLIWPALVFFQGLLYSRLVTKQVRKRRRAKLQSGTNGLCRRRLPDQMPDVVYPLVEGSSGDGGAHVGNVTKTLADVHEVVPRILQGLKERFRVLQRNPGNGTVKARHDARILAQSEFLRI